MARLLSRGALLLHGRGVTVHEVAAILNTAAAGVSLWLTGARPAPERLYTAVTLLAGKDVADELRQVIKGVEVAS